MAEDNDTEIDVDALMTEFDEKEMRRRPCTAPAND